MKRGWSFLFPFLLALGIFLTSPGMGDAEPVSPKDGLNEPIELISASDNDTAEGAESKDREKILRELAYQQGETTIRYVKDDEREKILRELAYQQGEYSIQYEKDDEGENVLRKLAFQQGEISIRYVKDDDENILRELAFQQGEITIFYVKDDEGEKILRELAFQQAEISITWLESDDWEKLLREIALRHEESLLEEEQDEGEATVNGEDDDLEFEELETIPDPIKPFNVLMFEFNDKLYFYLLKPVAQVYKAVLPEQVRLSIRSAISNVTTPVRFINCVLQGKVEKAGMELSRFLINTTFGILGIFDVAKKYGKIEKQDEDFGQTLGFYGVKEGFYIVWPVFGPSSVRDTFGMMGDFFADPFVYVNPNTSLGEKEVNTTTHSIISSSNRVNETSLTLGTYEEFKESSIDPYVAMRNAYFELRRNKIKK